MIPNGLDLNEFEKEENFENQYGSQDYIFYAGRIHNIKGLDILFKGVKDIVNEKLPLVLAGPDDNNYKNVLNKLAAKLGIQNYIKYFGPLKRNELIQFIKGPKYLCYHLIVKISVCRLSKRWLAEHQSLSQIK